MEERDGEARSDGIDSLALICRIGNCESMWGKSVLLLILSAEDYVLQLLGD